MSDFSEKVEKEEVEETGDDDNGPAPVRLQQITFYFILPTAFSQEEESTATFTPVMELKTVEVKTHEEDEDVVYKQ